MVFKRRILAKNNDRRQTSSEVKSGLAGLVLGWMPSRCTDLIIFYILSKSFFSHYHSFSLVLKHRKSVHLRNVIQLPVIIIIYLLVLRKFHKDDQMFIS